VTLLHPDVSHVLEIGGETAKFMSTQVESESGHVGIVDCDTNGDCAAGTGSFLDQQASRLRFRIEEVGEIALSSSRIAKIAGRCSVFAKSDMIHAQQKGASPAEVLRGLCEAVAKNFKANVVKGRDVQARTAFVGGVAHNRGVFEELRTVFDMDGHLFTPEHPAFYGALGAALLLKEKGGEPVPVSLESTAAVQAEAAAPVPAWAPLTLDRVTLLRDVAEPYRFPVTSDSIDVYLGVDVGSVSTNLVCIDPDGELIHEIYLRTRGRPVEVVGEGLREIEERFGKRIAIRGVGATGSGRELIGELLGADAVHDEITAHKTGAFRIARRHLDAEVDTIFEIGGQDSKYIHLTDGVVVDFAMNEACAAGTGSFLEEQAEKLGVNIVEEFSRLALASPTPVRLGERCTVFMERDVAGFQRLGAPRGDLVAGLSYAVVQNYLNRVVRGKPVGEVIFFQGGTAYNDAVAAAFAQVLGKPIVVPPHNGVVGAYGAALLALEKVTALQCETTFSGFHIEEIASQVRAFTCKGCSNCCDIQEYTVDGRKSYWGDKCSEKYRREAKVPREPVIPDLLQIREEALHKDYYSFFLEGGEGDDARRRALEAHSRAARNAPGITVGVPLTMYLYDQLPFWDTYLRALGFAVQLSGPTTKDRSDLGVEAAVAEPCYPVQVAHGHAVHLLREGVDLVLLPNVITAESEDSASPYLCPWGQTLPFVVGASPLAQAAGPRFLVPTVHFHRGPEGVEIELWDACKRFGLSRRHHRIAVSLAYLARGAFQNTLARAGREALAALRDSGQAGVVVVGRPYNLYDKGVNLNVAHKLRSHYGVNVVPLDFLPLEGEDVLDINRNMYWNHGRRILQAARFTSQNERLHLLYLTNFKCGPDSYVRQFCEDAAVKPFLALQFDGHGNDAGVMTRCEAYLDSKGIMRWWKQNVPSGAAPSTCLGCVTEHPSSSPPPSAP
jgi:predicted CoA-substrate-specific enzyme activase